MGPHEPTSRLFVQAVRSPAAVVAQRPTVSSGHNENNNNNNNTGFMASSYGLAITDGQSSLGPSQTASSRSARGLNINFGDNNNNDSSDR